MVTMSETDNVAEVRAALLRIDGTPSKNPAAVAAAIDLLRGNDDSKPDLLFLAPRERRILIERASEAADHSPADFMIPYRAILICEQVSRV